MSSIIIDAEPEAPDIFDDQEKLEDVPMTLDIHSRPKAVNTYRMKPTLREVFQTSKIKEIIGVILYEKLRGKSYNVEDAGKWTREISDEVCAAIKEQVDMPRYKHVVQVTLGQQLGSGCRYIAKCCWDAEADSHASDVFTNPSLFCVCTVFGVYLY